MEENLENKPEPTGSDEQSPAEPSGIPEPEEEITLSDAITGVFTEPVQTFEDVKKAGKKNFWLVPIIILIVLTIIASFMIMRDEELSAEIRSKQMLAVKEKLEEQVKEGKMTQEQMNERMDRMEQGFRGTNPIFLVFRIIGPIIFIFIVLFLKGLVFWGLIKALKGTATYMLVISVLGLTSVIESVQAVINTALSIVTGRLGANIGPILLFAKDALGENMSKLVSHFDLLSIWYFIILGIGLAKVSQLKTSKVMPVVFVLWVIYIVIVSFSNISFLSM
jgi:hypothetical protein